MLSDLVQLTNLLYGLIPLVVLSILFFKFSKSTKNMFAPKKLKKGESKDFYTPPEEKEGDKRRKQETTRKRAQSFAKDNPDAATSTTLSWLQDREKINKVLEKSS